MMFGKSEAEFTALYTTLMAGRGGVEHLTRRFAAVAAEARSDALVLLCFEDIRKAGLFCHRRVFAEWWRIHNGLVVDELPESGEVL
jgi:hypothetical protein